MLPYLISCHSIVVTVTLVISCHSIFVTVTEYHVICCFICYQVACFRLLQLFLTILFSAAVTVTYYNLLLIILTAFLTVTEYDILFASAVVVAYCFDGFCLIIVYGFSRDLFLHYLQYYRDSFQNIFLNLKPIVFTRS